MRLALVVMGKCKKIKTKQIEQLKQMKFLGLAILLISLTACGQSTKKNEATKENEVTTIKNGWKNLNENGYSIQYPENWDLNKSGQMGMSFIVLSRLTSEQDKFKENVNLMIQNLTGQNINLDKYVQISEGQISTMLTNGKLIESSRQNENNSEFHKFIYTADQGIYKLKTEQYCWVKNEKAYILTLSCEIDQYEKYKKIGEQILNSFKLN
jgi:hypothetical protein